MTLLDRLARLWRSLVRPSPIPKKSDPASRAGGASPEEDRDGPDIDSEDRDPDQPVVMPIEDSIDLHHFAPRDIPSVVVEYLHEARKAGFRDVRVIHGKGKGVQRRRVQLVLQDHPAVESSRSDGLGSTLVRLRPRPDAA